MLPDAPAHPSKFPTPKLPLLPHCSLHPQRSLPCSPWRTQTKWLRWHVPRGPVHAHWVGSGRVTLWHVSPIPPLDPYVRLSPHTAHERGILWERSISPAPRSIHRGQLYAFAGYLCTVSRPSPSGPSPWT